MARLKFRSFVLTALLLPLIFTGGCRSLNLTGTSKQAPQAQTPTSAGKQIRVVSTFLPVYLFTKAIAGDAANVEILIKPGTEVHEYQSTPADVAAIAQADVVVKNGLGIEKFLDDTLKSAENSKLKVIDASKGIQPIEALSPVMQPDGKPADDRGHEHVGESENKAETHIHEEGNPHVWLDPLLVKRQVENIRDGLIAADPANEPIYKANAAAYIQKLSHLNREFDQGLKPYRNRTFITFHDAFPYLAKRYRLKQEAVVAIPEDQLSPGDVQKTIATVKQFKIKAIFSEPGIDNKLLSGLSNDLNLNVYPLDSLESGQLEPDYYFIAMQTNLQKLQKAFQ